MLNSFSQQSKIRMAVIGIFLIAFLAVNLDFPQLWNGFAEKLNNKFPEGIAGREMRLINEKDFKLGLDLQGGTHLVYTADMSQIEEKEREDALAGVRDVIERRVNMFGVSEPVVQADVSSNHYRLIVELAGVKDVKKAIEMIGQTPYLEFKEEKSEEEQGKQQVQINDAGEAEIQLEDPYFKSTGLDGRMLKEAKVSFNQNTGQPEIIFKLNDEGAELFGQITQRNIGKRVAIYLDGTPISIPVVNEAIKNGEARITGDFTIVEARELVRSLNAGALPVPITIISQKTVGASLGQESLDKSLKAGILGFILIALFMLFYYRLPGVLAVISLLIYGVFVLAIFKLVPVTLTLAGIAGFILTIGMAVDANVLIFERMKEEIKERDNLKQSIEEGFKRAWSSIRDGNFSTLITAAILYGVGVSFVRGFALTLSIGVLMSMLTAVVFTRQLLLLLVQTKIKKFNWLWMKTKY
jgi:preprotein translocase subunit SecD